MNDDRTYMPLARHRAAARRAVRAYLRMGFLTHMPQALAFRNLVWTFIKNASPAASSSENMKWFQTPVLVDNFMEAYEQRLWPASRASASLKTHLSHPGVEGEGSHALTQRTVAFDVEGRKRVYHAELREGSIDVQNWGTRTAMRRDSGLARLLGVYFAFVKGERDPGTPLVEEQLLGYVMAGMGYAGDGKTIEWDPVQVLAQREGLEILAGGNVGELSQKANVEKATVRCEEAEEDDGSDESNIVVAHRRQ